ncbi:MAG TPA: alginate lyase family protein [Pyrinomonadaceae bacterium]|nr:alginate lyase family protein [Pyrinomonadaceae bacterium]
MKSKLHKLRQVGFDELRVRGSQAFAAFAERQNWSNSSKLISDDALLRLLNGESKSPSDLLNHFRERTSPKFFASFADPQATVNELRRRWPGAENQIVKRADYIVAGYFDLLGFRNLNFGNPIDWHLEPVAGKRAPLVHWSRLNYLDADLFGDKKITWELNRHQYFITLGQAYWLTGNERYAKTFVEHVNSWMDQNPPKLGINWASSLEIAFRSIAWIWALHFFKDSDALTPETFSSLCKFLYLNARHLETFLSTYFSPNTHLTGEALGLFYLGALMPEFKESARWRNRGLEILLGQLSKHVQPDGVYFEQSSYYHRYTTDFYLHLRVLLANTGAPIPSVLDEKLCLLLDHLMYITRPDGTTPHFGDDDGGRLLSFFAAPANDFRATLAAGAALFERADYRFVAGDALEDALWLLGPASFDQIVATEPEKQSVAFPAGGYYVMRDGWTAKSNYLLFDCGPHGTDNCGHAHADALSFELAVNGKTVLVDPGTYTYTGSKEMRDWFRSSEAHNTLTIDGESSSVSEGPFSWKTIARSECSSWITEEGFDYIVASHDGFMRLSEPAKHTRSILFIKNRYWVVRDVVETSGDHVLQARFHLDPRVTLLQSEDNTVRAFSENSDAPVLQFSAFAKNIEWETEHAPVSECYGEKKEALVLSISVLAKGSEELVVFLLPDGAVVREIEAQDGRTFEIEIGGRRDRLTLRDGENPPQIYTDEHGSVCAVLTE